jgi:hypothetical protein
MSSGFLQLPSDRSTIANPAKSNFLPGTLEEETTDENIFLRDNECLLVNAEEKSRNIRLF